jgi:hypothetical protein
MVNDPADSMARLGIRKRQREGQTRGLILRGISKHPQRHRVALIAALNGH